MFERYTEKARRVIFSARHEAIQFGSPFIDTEHLLLGILREDSAIANRLSRPPITVEFIRKRIEESAPPRKEIPTSVDLPLSVGGKRVLFYAAEEAERLSDKHINPSHLLLGLVREGNGLAAKILSEAGFDATELRNEIRPRNDTSRKAAYPQQSNIEDYVEIHGELWGTQSVRELSEYYRKFHWERRRWVPRDALVHRSNQKLYHYSGQSYDPEQFDLVKDGWKEDHCAICWWKLIDSEAPDRGEGLTNGQDWLCTDCYDGLIGPRHHPDL